MFPIKALIPTYPLYTGNITDCASEPSGFHLLSCPCNLVNAFQMSLMEIMCGFVPLLQPTTARLSQEDPLGQRYTAVTTATTAKSVLTVGGDAVRYATYYGGEKRQTASQLHYSLLSFLLQRELLY